MRREFAHSHNDNGIARPFVALRQGLASNNGWTAEIARHSGLPGADHVPGRVRSRDPQGRMNGCKAKSVGLINYNGGINVHPSPLSLVLRDPQHVEMRGSVEEPRRA
jgi:hypothetical protein